MGSQLIFFEFLHTKNSYSGFLTPEQLLWV